MSRKVLTLVYCIFIIGCSISKNGNKNQDETPFTQRELDFLSVIEYLKFKNIDCSGDCSFKVSKQFKYFDSCLLIWDSQYFNSIGLDTSKKYSYPTQSFIIPDFGRISFTHSEEYDYVFSPFIYDSETGRINGQVTVYIGSSKILPYKDAIGLNSIGNKIFMSADYNYPADNCYY